MKQYRYKVSPDIDKRIRLIAASLPEITKTDKSGKPLAAARQKPVTWEDLPAEQKLKHPEKEYHPRRRGENFQRPVMYSMNWSVPVLRNHYNELYFAYRESGEQGVENYVAEVCKITLASQKAAETITQKPADGSGTDNEI
jgi:hypothetical protein